MKNWKSTISGSVAALGTFLFGAPVALAIVGSDLIPMKWVRVLVLFGFVLQGLGIFFGHLFAADAKAVSNLKAQVDENAEAIKTGDTSIINKRDTMPVPPEAKGSP